LSGTSPNKSLKYLGDSDRITLGIRPDGIAVASMSAIFSLGSDASTLRELLIPFFQRNVRDMELG
jgi:hypothetical protein